MSNPTSETVICTRGNVTLTDLGDSTRVDVVVKGAPDGYSPAAIDRLVWRQPWPSNEVTAWASLNGGATVVGTIANQGSQYAAGIWIYSMDATSGVGSITPDFADSFLYADCTPLTSSGTNRDGEPVYGGPPNSPQTGYYQICGPDAFVVISMTVPPVSFAT